MVEISASILNIEKEEAIKTLYNLETMGIHYFHIDVMDGKFVENNTTDKMQEYCEYISQISNLPIDVHLMVEDVKSYVNSFLVYEPNIITFHIEAMKDKQETMEMITYLKENHVRVGISIKPNTKIEEIYEYLPYIHLILIMTVEPGKGGQKLLPETIQKIQELKQYIEKNNLETQIEADGGINAQTIEAVKQAGTDILVMGTALLEKPKFDNKIKDK